MSLNVWIGIGLLGGTGALARFILDGAVGSLTTSSFPLGTLTVNLAGALSLGLVAGAISDENALSLIAIGALGSFTTFSTWIFESQRLAEDGEAGLASINLLASLMLGLALTWIGLQIGAAL